jgi:hypothetical protein
MNVRLLLKGSLNLALTAILIAVRGFSYVLAALLAVGIIVVAVGLNWN